MIIVFARDDFVLIHRLGPIEHRSSDL